MRAQCCLRLATIVLIVLGMSASPVAPCRAQDPAPDDELQRLIDAANTASDWRGKRDATRALAELGPRAVPALIELVRDERSPARREALDALVEEFADDPAVGDLFIEILGNVPDDNSDADRTLAGLRYSSAWYLGSYEIESGHDALVAVFEHDKSLRLTAAMSLARLGDSRGFAVLFDKLGDDRYMARHQANLGVKALTGKNLEDFDYQYSEGAFVSGGVEAILLGRTPEMAELKAGRYRALAAYHRWLIAEHPELDKLLNPF